MHAGASPTFALLRVPRGTAKPSDEKFVEALQKDRERLSLPALNGQMEFEATGPFAITVDGSELDEYVVWEK